MTDFGTRLYNRMGKRHWSQDPQAYNRDEPPDPMVDSRNGWTTYIVLLKGDAAGFTNGPLK